MRLVPWSTIFLAYSAESKFQIFNYPTGEVISVTDFPDYVKRKGKECIEQEYEVMIPFLNDIHHCLTISTVCGGT